MTRMNHEFVKFIPDLLIDGSVYISIEYATAAHNCCCGCGEKVVTPLSPAQWQLTYDGETVSLSPSVGNGALPCNSHYWITRDTVMWAVPLTKRQTATAHRRDQSAVKRHYTSGPFTGPVRPMPAPGLAGPWRAFWSRVRRR